MIGCKVVARLNICVCGGDSGGNEEIQEVRYFVGFRGPVCRRPG